MAFRWPMRGGRLFVLLLALWGFVAPGTIARADTTNYLVNGSFAVDGGGWEGVLGGSDCSGAEPSMAPWGVDGLVFTYEYNIVYQDVIIPIPGEVSLSFTGQLGQAGGYYEASIEDADETSSTGSLVNINPEVSTLVVTTQDENEVVTVTFGGVDEAWWAGCYGPIITNASVIAEMVPPETTTTTLAPPEEYIPPSSGLDYWAYESWGGQPELPPTGAIISNGHIDGLDYDWGGGEVLDSGRGDGVIVRFEGWLSPPEPQTYYICAFTDDGFKLYLDDELVINDWWDRGPSCGNTADVDFSNGQAKRLTGYFYENGGGAVARLFYYTDQGSWATIPDSWYSDAETSEPPQTTTTSPTYFLGTPTGITINQTDEGVLVDWEASTEDVGIAPERYAISWSAGESGWGVATGNPGDPSALNTEILLDFQLFASTGGLDTQYVFTVRADNDSYGIISQQSIGVSLFISTPTPETTTTTEVPQTTTTTIPPTITIPPTTIDTGTDNGGVDDSSDSNEEAPVDGTTPSSTPENEVPESTPGSEDEEAQTETPVEQTPEDPAPEDPAPEDPAPEEQPSEEPTTEDPAPEEPTQEDVIPVDELEAMAPEEIAAAVEAAIEEGLSAEDAVALATSAKVLSSLDGDQAKEVFSSLDVSNLTDDEIAEVVNAVQEAPQEVRAAFEEEINIFGSGGAMDGYVPLGSKISVGERRVVIAATGVLLAGVPMPSSAPAPSQQSNDGSSGGSSESSSRKRKVR